ncbi:hypothetical protein CYMTET_36422, partial [Cymbomonas tetramitiformis]
ELVEALLDNGADPNIYNEKTGMHPLLAAAGAVGPAACSVVAALLERGPCKVLALCVRAFKKCLSPLLPIGEGVIPPSIKIAARTWTMW